MLCLIICLLKTIIIFVIFETIRYKLTAIYNNLNNKENSQIQQNKKNGEKCRDHQKMKYSVKIFLFSVTILTAMGFFFF